MIAFHVEELEVLGKKC